MLILGGGIAGLVAAFELKRQGHEPLVLEAQHRVGGRVQTIRDFAPGLYAEAGAMRIPRVHDLTLAYCDLFGLELRPFVMGNPSTLVYIDGQRMTVEDADREPNRLPFDLADHEKGKTWTQLWNEATSEFREQYEVGGQESLDALLHTYDQYSIREFLVMRGFSEGALELYGVMSFRESNMNAAVVEQLREIVGRCVRGHAGDRRRHGHAAARVLRADRRQRALRRRDHGHRAEPRRRHGALPRPTPAGTRPRATTPSVLCRSACCATSRSSARASRARSRRRSAS